MGNFQSIFLGIFTLKLTQGSPVRQQWRLEVDAGRTTQPLEISLFVKLYRKRSMGALISLGEPINESLPYDKGILSRNRLKSTETAVL
ncbi:hypothetical protein OMAG_001499 [Candidatus Omnitrophus magneticus]|uniref:Uncharacterized protein n=1 Tax=Candidatus Omnitrophus magneticus TaxID=1609969 RepID=A0A0F0CMQ2_9BACT|nr:hypothetical protein OMAG_001499 [Candidatus Omnitrophus magneticus]